MISFCVTIYFYYHFFSHLTARLKSAIKDGKWFLRAVLAGVIENRTKDTDCGTQWNIKSKFKLTWKSERIVKEEEENKIKTVFLRRQVINDKRISWDYCVEMELSALESLSPKFELWIYHNEFIKPLTNIARSLH